MAAQLLLHTDHTRLNRVTHSASFAEIALCLFDHHGPAQLARKQRTGQLGHYSANSIAAFTLAKLALNRDSVQFILARLIGFSAKPCSVIRCLLGRSAQSGPGQPDAILFTVAQILPVSANLASMN